MAVCAGTTKKDARCTANAMAGSRYCWHHDPDHAEERRRNASRAATLGTSKVGAEIRSTRLLVRDIVELTISGDLDPLIRKRLTEVAQLLQVYARLAELEITAAEEPLRSDLDVAGLTAQVLGRIEEMEVRERERKEHLAELVPAMEARGYDAGALKAIMGG